MRVCLGGTFDRLHIGHEVLLAKAFEIGDEVFIGLTSDRLARASRHRTVRPYDRRLRALNALLRKRRWNATVSQIDDAYGRSLEARYDAIVVSPETVARTREINDARRKQGMKPLRVFAIPFVYSDDGLRLSATRIAAGEIDARGRRRGPLIIAAGTENDVKRRAIRSAFQRAFPKLTIRVRAVRVPTGVPEQPSEAQTFRGARNRAQAALQATPSADYGVGVEAGLVRDRMMGRVVDVQYCVVVDRQGAETSGHGGGFYYPADLTKAALGGKTVSEVLGPIARDDRIGSTTGAIGFLTRRAIDREALTAHAVLMALVPRIRRGLYQE